MPLNAIDPTWINTVAMDSEELRRDMGFLLAGGASADVSRTGVLDPRALTVSLSGSNVQVNPGGCAVGTGKGAYLSGAAATATVDALVVADATNPRRDRVVLEILDPDNGGGAGRKAQFRVITGTPSATAASGGGYPAAPSSPSITLAYVDVPKSGNGSPVVTDQRPFTVAAGAPIPVTSQAERDALPKYDGLTVRRMAVTGRPVEVWDGSAWHREQRPLNLGAATDLTGVRSGWARPFTSGPRSPRVWSPDGVTVHITGAFQYTGGTGDICTIPAQFAPSDGSIVTYVGASVTSSGASATSPGQVVHLGILGGVLQSIYQGGSIVTNSYVPVNGTWRISG